jgi:hypothetical protein
VVNVRSCLCLCCSGSDPRKYDDLNQELLELDSEVYFNVCEVLNKRGRIWDVIKIFEEMKQDGMDLSLPFPAIFALPLPQAD